MMKTTHKILNRHAFSTEPHVDSRAPIADELMEKMSAFMEKYETDCRADSARLAKLESAVKDPEAQAKAGLKAGIRSGKGTEESMKQDNEKLKTMLSRPAFAAAYFVAQKEVYQSRKRMNLGLPQWNRV